MTIADAELISALWPGEAPSRVLRCRHCGRKNRVEIPNAVLDPASCRCGSCQGSLFLGPDEPLAAISSEAYEHDLDRRSMEALKALPGFPTALRWVLTHVSERSAWILSMSSNLRCDKDQFPELASLLEQGRARMDLPFQARLFLGESPFVNASTTGLDQPIIVVRSALLDHLTDTEVLAVLCHELGHIHAGHVLYRVLAEILVSGGTFTSGFLRLLTLPLQKALYKWYRCSELTCDRAGLLGCRDLKSSLGVFIKLAGGSSPGTVRRTQIKLAPFLMQARELSEVETGNMLDGLLAILLTMDASHPFLAWRAMHLVDWVEKGNYLDILAGQYATRAAGK